MPDKDGVSFMVTYLQGPLDGAVESIDPHPSGEPFAVRCASGWYVTNGPYEIIDHFSGPCPLYWTMQCPPFLEEGE